MIQRPAWLLVILVLTALAAPAMMAQDHPNIEKGFVPGKAYQVGEIDSVNLFNGNLILSLPIGPTFRVGPVISYSFVLHYNASNLWERYDDTFFCGSAPEPSQAAPRGDERLSDPDPEGGIELLQAQPDSSANAALGWSLSFGTFKAAFDGSEDDKFSYTSPDGAGKAFEKTLHEGSDGQGVAGVRYTRDGTYLRLNLSELQPGCSTLSGRPGYTKAILEFPDGQKHTFLRSSTCGPEFFLRKIEDRFGNKVELTSGVHPQVITDSEGRTHSIYLRTLPPLDGEAVDSNIRTVIDRVELGVAAGVTATYQFGYDTHKIARSFFHENALQRDIGLPYCDDPEHVYGDPPEIVASFLTSILQQPDDSSWSMDYNFDGLDQKGLVHPDHPGTIKYLRLPTGASFSWVYGVWPNLGGEICLPGPEQHHGYGTSLGVVSKTVANPNGTGGAWSYEHATHLLNGEYDSSSEEVWTIVKDPLDHEVKHYFRASYCPENHKGWDYSLPYTKGRTIPSPEPLPPHKSVEYFAGASTGSAIRTSYLAYENDAMGVTSPAASLYSSNLRIAIEKTDYHDTGGTLSTIVERSGFDGLGHYRTVREGSDFPVSVNRFTTTNYNPGPHKSYPNDFTPLATGDTWLLGLYDYQETTQGALSSRQEAQFEAATGFLQRKRALASGTTRGEHDVITAFTCDTKGRVTSEDTYGGDAKTLCTDCDLASAALDSTNVAYKVHYTYTDATSTTTLESEYLNDNGTRAGARIGYTVFDRQSGLPTESCAANNLCVGATYDDMGRIIQITPDQGAITAYTYYRHDGPGNTGHNTEALSQPRIVAVTSTNSGGAPGTELTRAEFRYDGLGRLTEEYAKIGETASDWTKKKTTYNALGWATAVSEVQGELGFDDSKATVYTGFDPFGRPAKVTLADGTCTDFEYTGVRQTKRKSRIGNVPCASAANSVTTETYDGFSRLVAVEEPSGASDGQVTTDYTYDQADRLRTVTTANGGFAQTRTFSYDNLGLLRAESIPEKSAALTCPGITGTFDVCYDKYDAKGHLLEKDDAGTTLKFNYDRAERLLSVTDSATTPNTLKLFQYDDGTNLHGYSAGKLWAATRYNRPASGQTGATVTVREEMTYSGLGGRVSQQKTWVTRSASDGSPQFTKDFTQSFTYDHLGALVSESYPSDSAVGPQRTVSYAYSRGLLTSVNQSVSAPSTGGTFYSSPLATLAYASSGMLSTVTHGNGVADVIAQDTTGMPRPQSIGTTGATNAAGTAADWTTGAYTYDGVGNILAMGDDAFTYDKVSRLTASSQKVAGFTSNRTQAFTYDAFGNMKTMTGALGSRTFAVDSATNWMNAGTIGVWHASYNPDGSVDTLTDDVGAATKLHWSVLGDAWRTRTEGSGREYTYGYDADGERVLVEDNGLYGTSSSSTAQGGFLLTLRGPDQKPRREIVAYAYKLSDNTTTISWSWSKDYLYRGGSLLASVSSNPSSVVRHYHLDHLGTPRLITDARGVVMAEQELFPFGEDATNPKPDGPDGAKRQLAERLRFTGHERDLGDLTSTTDDLDYMHARFYKPGIGRFISLDPAGESPGNPQSWNRYHYTANNPMRAVDPDGRTAWDLVDIGSAAFSVGKLWYKAINGQQITLQDNIDALLDVAGAALPAVPSPGTIRRGGKLAGAALDLASHGDEAKDGVKIVEGGADATRSKAVLHGNSKQSAAAQHGYEIVDTKTGEVVKTGVSGGAQTAAGGSVRGNKQANRWSREAGEPGRYKAEVKTNVPSGEGARKKILQWEAENAARLREAGQLNDPTKHVRP